jgi:soluble lytic murein transglycosylase
MNIHWRLGLRYLILGIFVVVLITGAIVFWKYRDYLHSPQDLYREAQSARPERAAELYARLSEKLPALKGYARLWTAEVQMPDFDAMRTLQAIIDFDPQSALAYEAHIARARYYASIESSKTQDEYHAALALNDTVALRLELARYFEQERDTKDAYAEYHVLLSKQPDAFEGMRRTGQDPLTVAQGLISATYYSDALETLQGTTDPKALPLRAQALAGLGKYDQARTAYQTWLQSNPDDVTAQMGLAQTLANLNRTKDALAIYQQIKTPDSQLAQADLLEDTDPNQARALDLNSPYPVAWWNATRILEAQKRLTETLPLYVRVAQSDSNFADDAAYRLYVLGKRLGDQQAEAQGKALLDGFGLDWLTIRANDDKFSLPAATPLDAAGTDILGRVNALESIGRKDLAHLELVLASRSRHAPEVDLAMAEGLSTRGYVVDAESIAEKYIKDHDCAPLEFWQLSYPRPYSDTVTSAAAEFGVDPLLIWAVMREESRFDPEALSYAGAHGLMQITPTTQTFVAEQLGQNISPGDAFLPQPNIRMGAWYLHFLTTYFKGDLNLAIMAYNGGAASVESWQKDPLVSNRDDLLRWIGFGETREYLERVSLSYRVYRGLYASGSNTK